MNTSPTQLTILRIQESYYFHLHVGNTVRSPSSLAPRTPLDSPPVDLLASTQFDTKIRQQLSQAIEMAAEQLASWHNASDAQAQSSALEARLRGLGGLLYSLLLPPTLQTALHTLPDALPLVLVTDDTELPWELLHDDRGYLLLQRPLSRRLLSTAPPRGNRATVQRAYTVLIIANPTGDLPETDREAEALMDLFDTAGQQITAKILARQQASLQPVREMLSRGDIDLIHYSGHARPGALRLHDGELTAEEIQRIVRGAPFVFLNGCASASEARGHALENSSEVPLPFVGNAIQNLAKAFLLGGASGFIGTLWPILDEGSRHLAEWFYGWSLQGASVGEALCQVRQRLFELHPGDPAWASYIHYGDPEQQLTRSERREIRTATVLMARLSGMRELYPALGLEQAANVETALVDNLTQIATRYGGEVRGPLTDLMGVHFGLSHVHEDNAPRAVRTALALIQELQAFVQRPTAHLPTPIALHVGISSGRVLSREVWKAQGPSYQLSGEIVDIAAGLASQAQAGEVLIDAATQRLVHRVFFCKPTAEIDAGTRVAHASYRVTGDVVEPVVRAAGQMVGRTREVKQLLGWWEEAQVSQGRLVEIVGRAGVGKSHLVQSVQALVAQMQTASGQSYRWVELRSHSYDEKRAYALLGQLIRELAQIRGDDDEESQRQKLVNLLRTVVTGTSPRSDEQVAEGLFLLGQPLGLYFSAPQVEQLEANFRQRRLAGLLQALLTRQAQVAPFVLVLEDLHWCDEASLAVWQEIVRAVDRSPMLLLPVFRSEWSPQWPAAITVQRLTLNELNTEEQAAMIADALGAASPPASLKTQLAAWSGGNPFFLKEALLYLQETGRLQRNEEQWQFANEEDRAVLPPTVEALVQARLNRLKPAWRNTLAKAAVIGQEFDRAVLEQIERERSHDDLDTTLDELVHRGLIIEVSSWAAETRYAFRHGILHQTVYGGLWDYNRRPVHRLVARALATLYGEGEHQVEVLAHHYYHSDDWVLAARYSTRAGQRAAAAHASRAAVEWYERALESLEKRTMIAHEHSRFTLDEEEIIMQRVEAMEGKADVLVTLGHSETAIQIYRQILSLEQESLQPTAMRLAELYYKIGRAFEAAGKYEEAAQTFQQGVDLLQDSPGSAIGRLYVWQGFMAFRQGYPDRALPLYDQGIALIEATDSPQELAQALNLRGLIYRRKGQHEEALATYARSEAICETAFYLPGLVRVFNNRGTIYQDQGRWDEALAAFHTGAELAARTGETWWQAGALVNQGEIYRRRGDLAEALTVNLQALAIGEPVGLGEIVGLTHMNIGAIYLKQQKLDEAQAYLDAAQRIFVEQDAKGHLCELGVYLTELALQQGRAEDAPYQAQAVLALAEGLNQPLAWGQAHRVMGQVQQAAGRFVEARASYLTSLSQLEQHPHELGMTFLRLAGCYYQQFINASQELDERQAHESLDALLGEASEHCTRAMAQLTVVGAQLELAEAEALAVDMELQRNARRLG